MTKLLLALSGGFGLFAGVALALIMEVFFGRVHRYRLTGNGESVYALVGRDREFVTALFALPVPSEDERRRRLLKYHE